MYYLLLCPHPHSCFRTFLAFRTFLPFIAAKCISNLIQMHNTLTMQDTNEPRLTYSSRELRELTDCMQHDNKYLVLNPCTIANICKFKINRKRGNTTKRQVKQPRGVNTSNLIHIRTVDFSDKDPRPNIRTATANASSVRNKDQIIVQELPNNDIEVTLITETWKIDTQEDQAWLNQSELCQGHYEISTQNRPGETRYDGIALIFNRNNNIKLLESCNTPTLEYAIWKYTIRNKPIHIFGMYHPPPKGKYNTTNGMFIEDITELLTDKLPQYQNSILLSLHVQTTLLVFLCCEAIGC